jgi:hypothetical protein
MAATTAATAAAKATFNEPSLHEQIMQLRAVDNWTNLGFLAFEYLCIAGVSAATIGFCEHRAAWGWPGAGTYRSVWSRWC